MDAFRSGPRSGRRRRQRSTITSTSTSYDLVEAARAERYFEQCAEIDARYCSTESVELRLRTVGTPFEAAALRAVKVAVVGAAGGGRRVWPFTRRAKMALVRELVQKSYLLDELAPRQAEKAIHYLVREL